MKEKRKKDKLMVLFKDGEKMMKARFHGVVRLGEANQLLSNPYAARWLFSFRLPPLVHRPIFHPPPPPPTTTTT